MKEYKFHWGVGPSSFECHIVSLMKEGWKPIGGAITWKEGRNERRFGQAMMREMVPVARCETCGAALND